MKTKQPRNNFSYNIKYIRAAHTQTGRTVAYNSRAGSSLKLIRDQTCNVRRPD